MGYDSPMAQDYYVKRFGFMFGGGRSGMYGLKALQADGLVAQKKEVKPAVQMRNRGHLLQERPSNLLLLLLHLQQAQEQALAESQAHGEAGTQEDGQHILQHLHGRPLTPVAPVLLYLTC